jgi:hypothetical protein
MLATVQIEEDARRALEELAQREGKTIEAILTRAVDLYRREAFLAGVAEDFAALRADPDAWAAEQAERQAWDATLGDRPASE